MTIVKRRILTGCFVLLFFVLAPLIIFYANGTIMGEGWNILATGGISVRGMKSGAELYVDGKLKDNISFFTRDYFLKNLKPDTYTILVKKEGYNEWTNQIRVYANMVSESNVFMLPTKIITTEVKKFLETTEENGTTTKTVFKLNPDYDMVKTIFSSSSVLVKYISNSPGIKENPIEKRNISVWSQDDDVFIGWKGGPDSSPTIFCEDSDFGIKCRDQFKVYSFEEKINGLDFFPGESEVVVVAVGNNIYAIEAEENPNKKPQILYHGKKPNFIIFNDIIYIKDGDFFGQIGI